MYALKILFSLVWLFHVGFSGFIDSIDFTGDSFIFFLISASSFIYMFINLLLLSQRKRTKGSTSTSGTSNSIHAKQEPLSKIVKTIFILLVADIALFVAVQLLVNSPSSQLGFSVPLMMAGVFLLIALLITSIMSLLVKRSE